MVDFALSLCKNSHMVNQFDWNALQSFLAVVRCGRLTVAAQQLGIDHSTLSRRITGLEKDLQVRLFDRQPSGYTLTPQGETLLNSAQAMETTALGILDHIAGASRKIAGTVRIGTPDGFGTSFLTSRLCKLTQRYPGLNIQLVTMPRVFSLSKREADIAISLSPPSEGRLHTRKLTDYELGLYGARHYLAQHPPVLSVAELKQHRFIGYIEDMIYSPALDYLPLVSGDIHPFFASSNLLVQYQATLQGHGLCILPCFMADTTPGLERILREDIALQRSFYMIIHSDIRNIARIRLTSDFIAREVALSKAIFSATGTASLA